MFAWLVLVIFNSFSTGLEVYVQFYQLNSCLQSPQPCDGSIDKPFDSVVYAMFVSVKQANLLNDPIIIINLQKGELPGHIITFQSGFEDPFGSFSGFSAKYCNYSFIDIKSNPFFSLFRIHNNQRILSCTKRRFCICLFKN